MKNLDNTLLHLRSVEITNSSHKSRLKSELFRRNIVLMLFKPALFTLLVAFALLAVLPTPYASALEKIGNEVNVTFTRLFKSINTPLNANGTNVITDQTNNEGKKDNPNLSEFKSYVAFIGIEMNSDADFESYENFVKSYEGFQQNERAILDTGFDNAIKDAGFIERCKKDVIDCSRWIETKSLYTAASHLKEDLNEEKYEYSFSPSDEEMHFTLTYVYPISMSDEVRFREMEIIKDAVEKEFPDYVQYLNGDKGSATAKYSGSDKQILLNK